MFIKSKIRFTDKRETPQNDSLNFYERDEDIAQLNSDISEIIMQFKGRFIDI